MKIVLVNQHPHDALGGSEIQCDLIAQGLAARGHEVTYLALHAKKTEYSVAYVVRPLTRPGFKALYREFRIVRPHVVYWRHGKNGLLAAALAAKLTGARFVHSLSHVADGQPWRSTYGYRGRLFPRSLAPRDILLWGITLIDPARQTLNFLAIPLLADLVVSNNRDFLDGVPCTKRLVIHNSMRTEAVPFTWPRPFVVWVANIKSRKRPEDFFKLSQALRDTDIDFLMVGAVQDAAYTALLATWTQAENFHYLGAKSLTEVNGILAASLLLTHTCEPEGFPNNCIQAWLQGKPVVSLRFDPEGLLEGRGLGCYSRDFAGFCSDVRKLIGREELRLQYGARAMEYARRAFAADRNIDRLESVLGEITGKPVSHGNSLVSGRSQ